MQRSGFERVAVAQTPYSVIPGAPSALERVAGTTTDMQYVAHQGFSANDATYWVDANALLRKAALEAIATDTFENGRRVRKCIQDRTVIEDTQSGVDLVARGWRLTTIRSACPTAPSRRTTAPGSSSAGAGPTAS
jgi:cellulose synthase (UDP-forming)